MCSDTNDSHLILIGYAKRYDKGSTEETHDVCMHVFAVQGEEWENKTDLVNTSLDDFTTSTNSKTLYH